MGDSGRRSPVFEYGKSRNGVEEKGDECLKGSPRRWSRRRNAMMGVGIQGDLYESEVIEGKAGQRDSRFEGVCKRR